MSRQGYTSSPLSSTETSDAPPRPVPERPSAPPKSKPTGALPYGVALVDGRRVPHPGEQKVLALILDLRRAGLSFSAIALRLNDAEIPSKHGRRWWSWNVTQIVRREAPDLAPRPDADPIRPQAAYGVERREAARRRMRRLYEQPGLTGTADA